ncbi:hypothetical protein [Clostridium pasteurianum]|nr:hypothetical protein [Clostridium pasteurianum]
MNERKIFDINIILYCCICGILLYIKELLIGEFFKDNLLNIFSGEVSYER